MAVEAAAAPITDTRRPSAERALTSPQLVRADRLKELGYRVESFNGGTSPRDAGRLTCLVAMTVDLLGVVLPR